MGSFGNFLDIHFFSQLFIDKDIGYSYRNFFGVTNENFQKFPILPTTRTLSHPKASLSERISKLVSREYKKKLMLSKWRNYPPLYQNAWEV